MKLTRFFKTCLPITLLASFFFSTAACAEPVMFTVENKTSTRLVALQISSNNRSWSAFSQVNLGAGKTAAFEWIPTPQSTCKQFIRGKLAQQDWRKPVKIDFCQDDTVNVVFD